MMSELDVAVRLGYAKKDEATKLIQEYDEIGAMLNTLIDRLEPNCQLPTANCQLPTAD
jgi:hypothetical protein